MAKQIWYAILQIRPYYYARQQDNKRIKQTGNPWTYIPYANDGPELEQPLYR